MAPTKVLAGGSIASEALSGGMISGAVEHGKEAFLTFVSGTPPLRKRASRESSSPPAQQGPGLPFLVRNIAVPFVSVRWMLETTIERAGVARGNAGAGSRWESAGDG